MVRRKILSIEDLQSYFFSQDESRHFSSKDNGDTIFVQVPAKMSFDDDASEELMPVTLHSCHTGKNLNGSNIDKENMENALPSFKNRPILGYIHEVDGQPEFRTHDMHLEEGDIVYDEVPVGIIPESCDAKLEYNEDKDRYDVVVNGYIFEAYSKAAEIIRREEQLYVSVELGIRELSYDAKERIMNIEDFFFSGVTILGKYEDGSEVMPGMEGSNITLADFTLNEHDKDERLINAIERLNSTLSRFNIEKFSEEGGKSVKFNELLEQYHVSAEDISFDYENMSDEELESAFADAFEEEEDTSAEDENFDEESDSDEHSESSEEFDEDSDSDDSEETDSEDSEADSSESFSVNKYQDNDKFSITFELSHSDIRYALYKLLDAYDDADNEYYYIRDVYDGHFVYEGWMYGNIYGQDYVVDGDDVSLEGERYSLHEELLTDSEYAQLQDMRSNYEALVQFKKDADLATSRQEKMDILNSEEYAVLEGNDKIDELIGNIDQYELSEFEKEAKVILADYIVSQGSFSLKDKKIESHKIGFELNPTVQEEPYGTLFSKK